MAFRFSLRLSLLVALMTAIAPGTICPILAAEPTIAQAQPSDQLQKSIVEGMRLFREGSKASLMAAIQQFEQALRLSQAEGQKAQQASALLFLGRIYENLGERQKALTYFTQALLRYRIVGDHTGEAHSLNNIGTIYAALGEKQKALDYFTQALSINRYTTTSPEERLRQRKDEVTTLNNIAFVYGALGDQRNALVYFNQVLQLGRKLGDRSGEGSTLSNIGAIYAALDEKPKALEYYNQALQVGRSVGDRSGEASTLNNIGFVSAALGERTKALEYYNQALLIHREIKDRTGEATTLNNIGRVYDDLGKKQNALNYYNQALPIRRDVRDHVGEASTLNNIGHAYYDLGKYSKALNYYNQALPLWHKTGSRSGKAKTLNNIGFTIADQKQPQLAIIFLKQSVSVYESLRQDIRTLPKETQESYTKSVESTYRKLADLLLKQDRILEAQQVLDLLKVQELNDYLKNVRGKSAQLDNLPPETVILKKYGELEASAIQLGDELAKLRIIPEIARTPAQTQRISQLVNLQEDISKQFNEFADRPDIQALAKALSREEGKQTVDTKQLDALRGELGKLNAVIITPLILEDRLELIITTPNAPPLHRTVNVTREELNKTIGEFRTALQNPNQDPKPIAQKLYNWLIKPLEADLAQAHPKTLIYAPDAQLRYIPLAALHDGSQWLTQRYAINLITAQSLTNFTAQPNHTPKILAGAIGNHDSAITIDGDTTNFAGLPFTDREVKSIQSLQPTASIVLDSAFTLNNIKPKFGDYNILHLATHATLTPKKPENSFIVFGNQTHATLKDIESWSLYNFDLVVLSACETGLGGKTFGPNGTANGAEILGLGYQFQTRGAKATIASLWQVSDGGTQILMTAFYAALKQGHTKPHALQLAQTALITNDFKLVGLTDRNASASRHITQAELMAHSSHPAYWAPFILIGNGL
jgi:CHAT domain-containing protein/Tfp pilus assembly protein PilF